MTPTAAETVNVHAYVPKEGPYQAQHGEDRWLEAFFGGKRTGFFVEVGAFDGVALSNSYLFETLGWRGVLVEPDPAKAARCRASRPGSRVFECAAVSAAGPSEIVFHAVEGAEVYSTVNMTADHRRRLSEYGLRVRETRVSAMPLDRILEEAGAARIDFVTIDVEEAELSVLEGFDIVRWRPELVMVETNSRFRKAEIRRYFVERGYVFHYSIYNNDMYVPLHRHRALTSTVDAVSYVLHRAAKSARFRLRTFADRLGLKT